MICVSDRKYIYLYISVFLFSVFFVQTPVNLFDLFMFDIYVLISLFSSNKGNKIFLFFFYLSHGVAISYFQLLHFLVWVWLNKMSFFKRWPSQNFYLIKKKRKENKFHLVWLLRYRLCSFRISHYFTDPTIHWASVFYRVPNCWWLS